MSLLSIRNPKAPAQAIEPSSPVDWLLGGLGIGAATLSAGFATYMVLFGPGQPTASPDFTIFARYDRRPRTLAAEAQRQPPIMPSDRSLAAAVAQTPPADPTRPIDFTPTGSVPPAPPASRTDPLPGRPGMLPGFALRDVFDGNAVVETRAGLTVARVGTVLEEAGEVLAIERSGAGWVVRTDRGTIGAAR